MLILRRHIGESVRIETSDGVITIKLHTIQGVHGQIHRFAIDAPSACRILRDDAVKTERG